MLSLKVRPAYGVSSGPSMVAPHEGQIAVCRWEAEIRSRRGHHLHQLGLQSAVHALVSTLSSSPVHPILSSHRRESGRSMLTSFAAFCPGSTPFLAPPSFAPWDTASSQFRYPPCCMTSGAR